MNITVTLTAAPELLVALLELSDALKGKGVKPAAVTTTVKPPEVIQAIQAPKEESKAEEAEPPKEDTKPEEEAPKVTKEMIRERLGSIMKAGKQKEVKALVAKYGASKVPDIKEEDYPAIYKEAEGLL